MELTTEQIYQLAPYAQFIGVEFDQLTAELVRARLNNRIELSTLGGGIHGGALMSLCDLSAAVCVGLNIGPEHVAATAESTTYFMKPVHGSVAVASARPIRIGRSIAYVEVDIHNDRNQHCVRTCQALAILNSG